MKIQLELSFNLEEEPLIFKSVEKLVERRIYCWENYRASVYSEDDTKIYLRASENNDDLIETSGILEVWKAKESPIPPTVDDLWTEKFKFIDYIKAFLEWHPDQKLLKLGWDQQLESYQEGKVKAVAVELLQSLKLELPPLVKVRQNY